MFRSSNGEIAVGGEGLSPTTLRKDDEQVSDPNRQTASSCDNYSLLRLKLTEENLAEGRTQLELIFDHRRRLLGNGHIATGNSSTSSNM
jgi:hypothetical protein